MQFDSVSLPSSGAATAAPRRAPPFHGARARRRKMPTVRLGGASLAPARRRGWWACGRRRLAAAARKLSGRRRLRWLRLRLVRTARAVRGFYSKLLRDLVEASASPGAAEARVALESLFSMPAALPISLAALSAPRLL